MKDFTDLKAWQESHKLVLRISEQTKSFPDSEKYGLSSQMRRAAVSITSNIAEGYGRYSYLDKARFYYIAAGSLSELKNQLYISKDLLYISIQSFEKILEQLGVAYKLVRGLIKKFNEIAKKK